MNDTAIRKFFDEPANGWDTRAVGVFERHLWLRSEPPRWPTITEALQKGSSRAFLGNVPKGSIAIVDRALATIEQAFRCHGFVIAISPPCHVVLWDMVFPPPAEWDLPALPEPSCPVAILADDDASHALVLLPTHDRGRFGGNDRAWLESAAIHEGFHVLLGRWLGRARMLELRGFACWTKFEEMCAVAMEACLLQRAQAWMDYGRSWQATLSLSHCDNDWSAFLDPQDGDFTHPVNSEDYGHFALLAFLDQEVWPARKRRQHWLEVAWEEGKKNGATGDPWVALDEILKVDGGVAELFQRYILEATFPTKSTGILGQLHKTFGPPAAASLVRGGGMKFFAIGPLAAQLLTCLLPRGTTTSKVRIVDYHGLDDSVVRAFTVKVTSQMRSGTEINIGKPIRQGKTKLWEFTLNFAKLDAMVQIVVMQPNHAGRSLAFTAEWQ